MDREASFPRIRRRSRTNRRPSLNTAALAPNVMNRRSEALPISKSLVLLVQHRQKEPLPNKRRPAPQIIILFYIIMMIKLVARWIYIGAAPRGGGSSYGQSLS